MSSRTKAAGLAAVLLAIVFAVPAGLGAAQEQSVTLSGDAGLGWGFTNATMTNPGPDLAFVIGQPVVLTLIGADSALHNWFIDYNDNLQVDPGEPSSPDFQAPSNPIITWSFVPDRLGNWTYRCRVHPTSMTGSVSIVAPTNVSLVGHAAMGWGYANETMANPGPRIVAVAGTNLTLTLIGNDSVDHNWFIDYNNDLVPNAGEPSSPDFDDTAPLVWTFLLDRAGNFTYRCRFHPTTMTGNIVVLGEERTPPPALNVALIPGIMILALGGVLVFAAVYHVRAVRASKRTK
jgi:plastocyanin